MEKAAKSLALPLLAQCCSFRLAPSSSLAGHQLRAWPCRGPTLLPQLWGSLVAEEGSPYLFFLKRIVKTRKKSASRTPPVRNVHATPRRAAEKDGELFPVRSEDVWGR